MTVDGLSDFSGMVDPELATPDQKRAAMVAALRGLQQPQQSPNASSPDLIFSMGQNSVTQPLAREAMQASHLQQLNGYRTGQQQLGLEKLAGAFTNQDTKNEQGAAKLAQGQERVDQTNAYHQGLLANGAQRLAQTKAAGAAGMDPRMQDAIDRGAQYLHQTGQMLPGLGNGKEAAPLRRAILMREAELAKQEVAGTGLAEARAGFGANAGSLRQMQGQADKVDAFERTALANLDTFLGQAKQIKDTGSPLLNKPVRWLDENLAGNPEMSAFNASRQTAVSEIGKILSGAMGSGAISDSARHEVEGLMGPNATLAQLLRAAEILKQDMGNRKSAVQGQLKEMHERIGGQAKPEASTGAGGVPTSGAAPTHWLVSPDGKMRIQAGPDGKPVPGAKAEANPAPPKVASRG